MKTRAFVTLLTLTSLLATGPVSAASTSVQHSTVMMGAKLPPLGAGAVTIKPFSKISALVSIIDTGTSLQISGQGTGFNTTLAYTSFFYGAGSVPTGSLACIPPTPNTLSVTQMITAYWLPVGSSRRTLKVVNSGASYTPLGTIGTMSVRYDTTPNLPLNVNLNPGRFWLNSCGALLVK